MIKKTIAMGVAIAGLAIGTLSASAAIVDLGFAIDESGSVTGSPTDATSELGLVRQGLASALNRIPSTGAAGNPNTYRVTIVQFASGAGILVNTTEITDASRATIQNVLLTNNRISGGTNIGSSVQLLNDTLCLNGCTADTTIFNVATDGQGSGNLAAEALRAASLGVDSLNYEAIGSGASTAPLLATAFPGTPVLVDDVADLPNPLEDSFVLSVDSFADFEGAISAKVGQIVDSTGGNGGNNPNVVPLPAGLPLLLVGIGAFAGLSRRKSTMEAA